MIRKAVGIVLFILLGTAFVLFATAARALEREESGAAEADTGLEVLTELVRRSYADRGTLCETAPYPYYYGEPRDDYRAGRDEAVLLRVGFTCLGLHTGTVDMGRAAYLYRATQHGFVLTAFREGTYDPDGEFPRFERRGEIRDGSLVIDPVLHRLPPGGHAFTRHLAEIE